MDTNTEYHPDPGQKKTLSDWAPEIPTSTRIHLRPADAVHFANLSDTENAYHNDTERLRLAIDASSDGIWDWNLLTGEVFYNPAYFAMLGLEPRTDHPEFFTWLDLVHPDDRREAWDANFAVVEGQALAFDVEFRMRHKNGTWRWIKSRGKSIIRDGNGRATRIIGSHTDITTLKQSEIIREALYRISEAAQTVADLEELFREIHEIIGGLMDAKNFYIALYDEKANLISFPYFADEFDSAPGPHHPGRGLTDYVLRSGQPLLALPEVYEQLVSSGEVELIGAPSLDWLGVPLKTQEKTIGLMAVQTYNPNVRYTRADQDMLVFISSQAASAIERKRAADQIRKLNRTMTSISQVNQVLVRAEDEKELMRRVCQILVDTGEYPLAWIGFVEKNEANSTRPVVFASKNSGLMTKNQLSWNEFYAGVPLEDEHPTSTADHNGQPVVRNHLQALPRDGEIPCLATRCGFGSSISLPLMDQSQEIGALHVYSYSPVAFDTEETELLVQMSEDLAFGLGGIRERARRKRAEMELKASDEKLDLFFSQSLDGYFFMMLDEPVRWDETVDKEAVMDYVFSHQRLTKVNNAMLAQYGATPDQFIGLTPKDLFAHNIAAGRHAWFGFFDSGHLHTDTDERRLDGTQMWVEKDYILLYDSEKRITGHFGIQRDVTARRKAEEALRENEEKYRSVVERANDGITILQDQRVVYSNQKLAEMWGGRVEELLGRPFTDFVALDATFDLVEKYNQRISGKVPASTYTTTLKRKDGSLAYAELNAGMLTLQGNPTDLVIIRDITERKQAELERARRLVELEAVNRISSALRTAQSLDEMLPRLLDETLAVMATDAGAIWLYDAPSRELRPWATRGWFTQTATTPKTVDAGISGIVFTSGKVYQSQDFRADPHTRDTVRGLIPPGWGGACIPIYTSAETVGVFYIGVRQPRELKPEEMHLLMTLAEIGGNAIYRMRLHAQAELHVKRLNALRVFDVAITTSLDLRLTLEVLLEQATTQLGVDAADVLLFNEHAQTLEYAAGRGFRSSIMLRTRLRLGDEFAGRAALDRRIVSFSSQGQNMNTGSLTRGLLLPGENFRTYYGVPLLSKGNIKGVLELFHREPLNPDLEWREFLETLAGQAAIAIEDAQLFNRLQRSNTELTLAYDDTIEGWSRALELRDRETKGHSQRVTEMTTELALQIRRDHYSESFSDENLVHLRRGSLLHDIGKMGMPDKILLKPGPLTPEEWNIMRKHPEHALEMLMPIDYLRPALDIPYCHHEKWDGSGYPRGLRAEQIPLAARIFAVVDVWDALTSDRPYQKAWAPERALNLIIEQSGKHFDPQVVDAFLKYMAGRHQ